MANKDKYRPSTADFEVTESTINRPVINPGMGGAGDFLGGTGGEPEFADDDGDLIPGYMNEEELSRWIPKGLKVAGQVVRYSHDGRMRVDVTFEWDAMPEAIAYYVRVAPA